MSSASHTVTVDTGKPGEVTWSCSCGETDWVKFGGWDPFASACGAASRHVPVGDPLQIKSVSIPNPGVGTKIA